MTLREKQKQKEEERKKIKSVLGVVSELFINNVNKNVCISILDGQFLAGGTVDVVYHSNFPYFRNDVLKITETKNCVYIFI